MLQFRLILFLFVLQQNEEKMFCILIFAKVNLDFTVANIRSATHR